jgi:hypothetical protein
MDVSYSNDKQGFWRHRPSLKLPRANLYVEREFRWMCRNSEKRK